MSSLGHVAFLYFTHALTLHIITYLSYEILYNTDDIYFVIFAQMWNKICIRKQLWYCSFIDISNRLICGDADDDADDDDDDDDGGGGDGGGGGVRKNIIESVRNHFRGL